MSADFKPIATLEGLSHFPICTTLLLGLGNDILCDDAIGLLVAREIRKRATDGLIDIRETCEIGLALLDHIIGYKNLIIVDAIHTGKAPPGFIHELDAPDTKIISTAPPHFLGIGEMITLGTQLGLSSPRAGQNFRHRNREWPHNYQPSHPGPASNSAANHRARLGHLLRMTEPTTEGEKALPPCA